MAMQANNLFGDIPATVHDEFFQILAEKGGIRIERIVSDGQSTPTGEWYDQEWDEWVLLVSGSATLLFENELGPLSMQPGDHIMIQAGCRHRVEKTDSTQKTIWLAVHFGGNNS